MSQETSEVLIFRLLTELTIILVMVDSHLDADSATVL
jgi:hypothetical protein